ncbi:MAG: transcription antitermination factor NusB [Rickettsiales bacterium]|nr:transcription antitermination factor NusB [Rickettsiales bacterium]
MTGENASIRKKRSARIAAIQGLYNQSVTKHNYSPEQMMEQLLGQWQETNNKDDIDWEIKDTPDKALLRSLLVGVHEHLDAIQPKLHAVVKENWSLERMSPILQAILQLGVYELMFEPKRNRKIIVDEYTKITSSFFDNPELGFIHSALNMLASELRPDNGE